MHWSRRPTRSRHEIDGSQDILLGAGRKMELFVEKWAKTRPPDGKGGLRSSHAAYPGLTGLGLGLQAVRTSDREKGM